MAKNPKSKTVCANCGKFYGLHNAGDDYIPFGTCPAEGYEFDLKSIPGTTFIQKKPQPYDYVLLWCVRRKAWWRENCFGYSRSVEKAGLYSRVRAEEIAMSANIRGVVEEIIVEVSRQIVQLEVSQMDKS